MTHENLQLSLNVTKLREALKADPKKIFKANSGDVYVTIFCDVRRNESSRGETHALNLGKIDGKTTYVGGAKPSKFQPNGADNRTTQSATNDSTDVVNDLPF